MDEWDELARSIHARIDYETKVRNKEYIDRHEALLKENEKMFVELNGGFGPTYYANKAMEALEKEFAYKKEFDQERYQGYWDRLSEGTYREPTLDEEKEIKMQSAEVTMKGLNEVFNGNIPPKLLSELKKEHGEDILEILYIRKKQQEEQAKRAEQQKNLQKIETKTLSPAEQLMLKYLNNEQSMDGGQTM